MSEIGINVAALIIVTTFSVIITQTIGGFSTYYLNKGISYGKIQIKGLCPQITIPPLFGMLIFGIISRNAIDEVVGELDINWSVGVWQFALTTVLLRAGLSFNFQKLRQHSSALLRLTIFPQVFEAIGVAIAANNLLGFSWSLSLAFGFMIGAVAPAVVVPSCIKLRNQGYGIHKGVPSIVIAASSLDLILAIACKFYIVFGIFLGIAIEQEGSKDYFQIIDDKLYNSILLRVFEIIFGFALGTCVGFALWLLDRIKHQFKALIIVVISITIGVISWILEVANFGFIATITLASLAERKWGKEEAEFVDLDIGYVWILVQVPLFGLIGATIYLPDLDGEVIGYGVLIVFIGLLCRYPAAYCSLMNTHLDLKERIFVMIAWTPKGTVQAVLSGIVLALAKDDDDDDFYSHAYNFITVAVLSIIIAAPLGAILTALFGPKLLEQNSRPLIELSENVFAHNTVPVIKTEGMSPDLHETARQQVRYEWFKSISAIDNRQVDDALKDDKLEKQRFTHRSSSAPPIVTQDVLDLAQQLQFDNPTDK